MLWLDAVLAALCHHGDNISHHGQLPHEPRIVVTNYTVVCRAMEKATITGTITT